MNPALVEVEVTDWDSKPMPVTTSPEVKDALACVIRDAADEKAALACEAKFAALVRAVAMVVEVVTLAAVVKAVDAEVMKIAAFWNAAAA
jgi:hypothetical protein